MATDFGRGAYSGGGGGATTTYPGRGAFNQVSSFGGGRGRSDFTQDSQEAGGYSRGGGGRGRGNQDSEGGRGGYGRGTYNQDSETGGYSRGGRGHGDSEGGRGGFGRGRGNQDSETAGYSRGGRGRGDSEGGRGGYGRGTYNQDSETGGYSRGGRGRGDSEGGRGGFGRGRGNQDSEDGRGGGFNGRGGRGGNFNNQESSEGGQYTRGGGRGRGRGGNQNHGDQENQGAGGGRGGYNQNRTDDEAPGKQEGDATQPLRAPANFIPKARNLEQIYQEDEDSAAAYAEVVDFDDDVIIENSKMEVVRIQNWEEADFDPKLLENVKMRSKYSRPRKIQGAVIPFVLDLFDVIAQAETGSGKTAAFLLPILDSCIKAKKSQGPDRFVSELCAPYAVILGPTRELVLQVYEQALKFSNGTGITVAKAYGQYNINRNHDELRNVGCDILIATVGRLKHFVLNEDIFVNKIRYLVLDEADRLMDQSFFADIEAITKVHRFPTKDSRITMLFSATFNNAVMEVANKMMKPNAIFVTNQRNDANKKIKQDFILLEEGKPRIEALAELLKEELNKVGTTEKMRRTLVFVNTKRSSDMAALYLCQNGIEATSINSDRPQNLREEALRDFRNQAVSVLISTDVTARGIDVKHLDHVINLDLPFDVITYVHRVGRTGRIAPGFATTFTDGTEPILSEISNMLEKMGTLPESLKKAMTAGRARSAATTASTDVLPPRRQNFAASTDAPPSRQNFVANNGPAQPPPAAAAPEPDYPGNDF